MCAEEVTNNFVHTMFHKFVRVEKKAKTNGKIIAYHQQYQNQLFYFGYLCQTYQ